jgi:hypothetical protein
LGQLGWQNLSRRRPVWTLTSPGRENDRIRVNVASRRVEHEPITG